MKKIAMFFTLLVLFVSLCVPAVAAEEGIGYVLDTAYILSEEEVEALDAQAQDISQRYQCGVYIMVLNDYTFYSDETVIDFAAEDIYTQYDLGWGGDKSGLLLLLSMADRDYVLLAYGYGNVAFTNYGKDVLSSEFLDDFGNDDWYSGFSDYLAESQRLLHAARDGNPVDIDSQTSGIGAVTIIVSLGLGCVVALIVCAVMKSGMKSVSSKAEAGDYLVNESVNITVRQDLFTHHTSTRVRINNNNGSGRSGGGSGGTSVRSSGFSSKSGKF